MFVAWSGGGPEKYWVGIRRDTGATGWGIHINDVVGSNNLMGASLVIGEWHHFAIVFEGTTKKFYFNGNFITSSVFGASGFNGGARNPSSLGL